MAQTSCWLQTLVTFLFLSLAASQSSYVDQDDWVDPDDVMNYDRVSKTMIKPENTRSNDDEWVDPNQPECPLKCCNDHRNHVSNFQARLSKCEDTIITLLGSQQTCPDTGKQSIPARNTQRNPVKAVETMYMKRFVNILLRESGLNRVTVETDDDILVKTLLIAVKKEQLIALRQFGENDKMTLGDLDNILSEVLQSTESGFTLSVPVEWIDYLKYFFSSQEIFLHLTTWAIILLPLLMIGLQQKLSKIISTFVCLILVCGFQWKYNYMVKMAEVEQLLTTQKGPPPECRPDLMTWMQSLRFAFVGDPNICRQYHVSQMVSPAMAITPTLVLAHLVADTIARPMEAMGQGIGRFCNGILEGLSWYNGMFVLLVVLSLITVIIVASMGGTIGNMLFSISGPRQSAPHRINVESVSALPPAANPPALNTPTVVHHVHHDGRDLAGGDAAGLATPPRLDERRLRAIDRRLGGSPLLAQGGADSWIKNAISPGVGFGSPEREGYATILNDQTPSRSQSETSIDDLGGSGDNLEKKRKAQCKTQRSSDSSVRVKNSQKRFLERDLKSRSRESVQVAEDLQKDSFDNSAERCADLVSLGNESVTEQSCRPVDDNDVPREGLTPASSQTSTALNAELIQDNETANESGGDFITQVVDAFGNDSFSERASGNESSTNQSEFITSLQNILSEDDDVTS